MKALKSGVQKRGTTGMTPLAGTARSDRYEKKSSRRSRVQQDLDDIDNIEGGNDIMDEQRSIHAELDYTKKDATRHIVAEGIGNSQKKATLRERLMRHLEGVRKNKPILRSDYASNRSHRSNVSRKSQTSRVSTAAAAQAAVNPEDEAAGENNDGRLTRIEEAEATYCEVKGTQLDEEDLALCDDIAK